MASAIGTAIGAVFGLGIAASIAAISIPATPQRYTPTVEIMVSDGLGSGVYIGHRMVLTAGHVAKDQTEVSIVFERADGKPGPTTKGKVLWIAEKEDVAAIQVKDVPEGTAVATVEPSEVPINTSVEVVGNPFGIQFIHTYGKIAGATRKTDPYWPHAVPIDVEIAPGNSGGPVYIAGTYRVAGLAVGVLGQASLFGPLPGHVDVMVSSHEIARLLNLR